MSQPFYHPSRLAVLIFSVILARFSLVLAQKCYYPDQKTIAVDFTPCNISAIEHGGDTTCCAHGAACLTSGLCYLMYDTSINAGACTDSSWATPNCFQKCPSDYGPANTNTLYRCDNDQWCCSRGGNKTSCCNDPNVATFLPQRNAAQIYNGSAFAAGFALSQTSAFTSSASASAARATGTKATATRASGDSSPTTSGSCNNNTCPVSINDNAETTKVGVGVSVGLGIPLLVALAVTLFLWSREKKRSRDFQQQAAMAGQQLPWGNASVGYGSANGRTDGQQTFYEVPGQTGGYGVAEMVGGDGRREMAGNPTVK